MRAVIRNPACHLFDGKLPPPRRAKGVRVRSVITLLWVMQSVEGWSRRLGNVTVYQGHLGFAFVVLQ